MPPANRDRHKDNPDQPSGDEERAVIVIADGAGMPALLDRTRAHVNRIPGMRAVDVEHDAPTRPPAPPQGADEDMQADGFTRAVVRRNRGEFDRVVLPSPDHLPEWLLFTEGDPRRRRQ